MVYKKLGILLVLASILVQCTSAKRLEKKAPSELQNIYFQVWNSGIEKGGSGVVIHAETTSPSLSLDSIYFRGQAIPLIVNAKNKLSYTGRYKIKHVSDGVSKIPFHLKDDEAVIRYVKNKRIYYYKIEHMDQKPTLNYPSTSPKRN